MLQRYINFDELKEIVDRVERKRQLARNVDKKELDKLIREVTKKALKK